MRIKMSQSTQSRVITFYHPTTHDCFAINIYRTVVAFDLDPRTPVLYAIAYDVREVIYVPDDVYRPPV